MSAVHCIFNLNDRIHKCQKQFKVTQDLIIIHCFSSGFKCPQLKVMKWREYLEERQQSNLKVKLG